MGKLVISQWVSALALVASAAADKPLPLVVDGTMVVADNVRVGGTSEKGATVSVYTGATCGGDALATTTVEEGGRFTVAVNGRYEPPFTISLRATAKRRRSACFEVTVPAARQPQDDKR